ncbi:MAG: UDP-N-acetylmuramoyl-tripeptide--D-alanyl-D-alanine ligase [Candidatus Omnitrophica bacterium]|nr:UDP-N-acetylmuramoyl-tripeptide--D-alanyl-D-alanine ligase [Candidatus Omnitrophota bacterium]
MFSPGLNELLKACNGKYNVSTDTRTIKEGDLFIALRGNNFDGHFFLYDAAGKGAAGAITDRSVIDHKPKIMDFPVFKVKDTLKIYGDIAAAYRLKFNIPLIGITGSSGKTTTKEMTARVLSVKFKVLSNEGTENNLIGVPKTLLKLTNEHEIGVVELGSNHFGEIKRLAKILKPTIGIITNIGPAHLEFFKSESGVLREKAALLGALDKNGIAIINADDLLLSRINGLKCRVVRVGIKGRCLDFRASDIVRENGFINFKVNGKYDFRLNLFSEANVYNALVAIAVGAIHKIDLTDIAKALSGFEPLKGRLGLKKAGSVEIIDDTYNSNPQSLKAAIEAFANYKPASTRILVCGDMLELGGLSERFHREAGRLAARSGMDYLVSVGNFSDIMKTAALAGGMEETKVFSCKDNACAVEVLKRILRPDSVVMLKGSRLVRLNEVADAISSFIPA